jgi:hypothetical protein
VHDRLIFLLIKIYTDLCFLFSVYSLVCVVSGLQVVLEVTFQYELITSELHDLFEDFGMICVCVYAQNEMCVIF